MSLTGTEGLSDPTEGMFFIPNLFSLSPEKVQKLPGGKIKKTVCASRFVNLEINFLKEAPSVTITTAARTKRKHTTTITGLKGFGISLEAASKGFRGKFACGASITKGKDEIVIQGDVKDDLYDILVTVYKVMTLFINVVSLLNRRKFLKMLFSFKKRRGRRLQPEETQMRNQSLISWSIICSCK